MSNDTKKPFNRIALWRKGLSLRIFLMLFLAFLSVELLLLYPIIRCYEVLKLENLEQQALLSIHTLFNTLSDNGVSNVTKPVAKPVTKTHTLNPKQETEEVQKIAKALLSSPLFKGVVIAHEDGTPFLRLGEKPERPMNDLPKFSYLSASLRAEDGTRYDVFWDNEDEHLPYDVTVRLDTTHFPAMLEKFLLLTLTWMLLIAFANTIIAFIVFKRFVLNALMKLKNKVVSLSSEDLQSDRINLKTFSEHPGFPENVFGEIENKYNELLKRLIDAQKTLRAHDAVLELRVNERTKELAQLANYDLLTELPNRNLLLSTLDQYIEHAKDDNKNIVLLIMILRDFHEIRNAYGQNIGTQLLKKIAQSLVDNTPSGTLVAHLSTSHFAIARGGLTAAHHITNLAQWIIDIFSKPLTIENQNLLVSVNVGISIYPMDGDDAESMISNANLALERAIQTAPNSYQFYETNMNKITETRRSILVDLHYAIERKELVAYYQPQVDLKNNEIIGVEALLRWKHPEKGLMPPAFFISLAEESGLIVPMGEWVLREACSQAKKWAEQGLPKLNMSVNLSGAQFKQKNIIEVIHRVILETEIPPEQLELEITESIIMNNIQAAIATMKALRGLGLSISIDDFGTGYSSLSYLRRFPIQKLKIDQSFVKDIGHSNGFDTPLADIILLLAKNLNLHSIAEGIENEEQAEYLRSRGCQEGQGYLFGKPMTASEIENLLNAQSH